jgi:hypothetical protein
MDRHSVLLLVAELIDMISWMRKLFLSTRIAAFMTCICRIALTSTPAERSRVRFEANTGKPL